MISLPLSQTRAHQPEYRTIPAEHRTRRTIRKCIDASAQFHRPNVPADRRPRCTVDTCGTRASLRTRRARYLRSCSRRLSSPRLHRFALAVAVILAHKQKPARYAVHRPLAVSATFDRRPAHPSDHPSFWRNAHANNVATRYNTNAAASVISAGNGPKS